MKIASVFFLVLLFLSCKEKTVTEQSAKPQINEKEYQIDSVEATNIPKQNELKEFGDLPDTTFIRLADYSHDFSFDMRYATTNNFLKAKVYDCAECYTRVKTAKALIRANKVFMTMGYRIQFFDCYRPNSVQYKMWELFPNPQYVANPVKGSIHNKGGAVDITLIDFDGKKLDMGTDFDFFGENTYTNNENISQEAQNNRKYFVNLMDKYGFENYHKEWWHFTLRNEPFPDTYFNFPIE